MPSSAAGTAGAIAASGSVGRSLVRWGTRSTIRVCHAPLTAWPSAYADFFLFHKPVGRNRAAQDGPPSFHPQRHPQRRSRLSTSRSPAVNNLAGFLHSIIPRPGETRVDGSGRPCHGACARGLREGKGPRSVRGRQSAAQRPNGDLVLIGQRNYRRGRVGKFDQTGAQTVHRPSPERINDRSNHRKPGIECADDPGLHLGGRVPVDRPIGLPRSDAHDGRRVAAWPISSSITRVGMPSSSSQVAKVWRRSCGPCRSRTS